MSTSTSLLIKDVSACYSTNDVFVAFTQLLKSSVNMNSHATIVKMFAFLTKNHSGSFDAMNSVMKNSHFAFEHFEKKNKDDDDDNNAFVDTQPIVTIVDDDEWAPRRKTNKRKCSSLTIEASGKPVKTAKLQTNSVVSNDTSNSNNNNNNSVESTLTQCVLETLQKSMKNNDSSVSNNLTTKDTNERTTCCQSLLMFFYCSNNEHVQID